MTSDSDFLAAFGRDGPTRIQRAIAAQRAGRPVLVLDDPSRENEADLIIAAEIIDEPTMAMMIRHGSGIVCLCLTAARLDALRLPPMVTRNTSRQGTAFSVSIEAREGVTTGVSAADRVTTVRAAIGSDTVPEDLARPGHVFPIRARDGGVLERRGHTEAAVDLARLSGFSPAGVLCELMNDDGTMARGDAVLGFAAEHNLVVTCVQDLVEFRELQESVSANRGRL